MIQLISTSLVFIVFVAYRNISKSKVPTHKTHHPVADTLLLAALNILNTCVGDTCLNPVVQFQLNNNAITVMKTSDLVSGGRLKDQLWFTCWIFFFFFNIVAYCLKHKTKISKLRTVAVFYLVWNTIKELQTEPQCMNDLFYLRRLQAE